jgi:hypothetical protein
MFVVMIDVGFDGGDQFDHIAKTPLRKRFAVRSRKKRSTMFSQESAGGREVDVESRMAF